MSEANYFEMIMKAINELTEKVDGLGVRMDRLETRMDSLETRIDRLETGMNSLETRIDGLEKAVGKVLSFVKLQSELANTINGMKDDLLEHKREIEKLQEKNAMLA